MKAAISNLENSMANLETNEPIHRAEGKIEQADLDQKNAVEIREGLAVLQRAAESTAVAEPAPVAAPAPAPESSAVVEAAPAPAPASAA